MNEANSKEASEGELVEKLIEKRVSMHSIESLVTPEAAARIRRKALERIAKVRLDSIGSTPIDYSAILNKNAENAIGGLQMPLGIAGPILVNGNHARGEFYVPMATTEGALIASINRGMKAVTESNGATVRILKDAISRAPVFEMENIEYVVLFLQWLDKNFEGIKRAAESTTKHGKLKEITPFVLGNNVWLRLSFETGDAMGMNMVTIASEAACSYIESEFKNTKCIAVSGNMCSDKKESAVNSLLGRGKTVMADALIKGAVIKELFKTTAESIHKTNLKKNILGSARAGSSKYNGHFANVIAAVFAATGQDIAQVVESSSGYTWTEVRDDDLYISVTLPSLEVGTVGGGTTLSTQREALSIMGVAGSGARPGENSSKFSEIIAATVLAGELNLLGALFGRELGRAHKKLGRNMKQ